MALTNFVKTPKLKDYQEQFKEHLSFERKNGILQVRMNTHGGPVKWSFQMHQALAEAWSVIGHDPENELLILTSTDPYWIGEFDKESFAEVEHSNDPDKKFNSSYHDATKLVENFVFDMNIPTIGAKTPLEWGLVNEVLPREKILPRAWEIAEKIMKQPRIIRQLTHQLTTRPWKRLLVNDFQVHTAP